MPTLTPRAIKMRENNAAKAAADARMAQARAETLAGLQANLCPQCGAGVHHNLALTGWMQCDRFGSEGFRKDPTGAQCSWQGFWR